jgi:hypothetical protein
LIRTYVLPVRCDAEHALAYEVIEDYLTCDGTQSEQARGLSDVQREAGHFAVGADDHRFEMTTRWLASVWLASVIVAPTESAFYGLGVHMTPPSIDG